MELLHVVPLYMVIAALVASGSYKIFSKKSVDAGILSAFILSMCSIGIVAGDHVHHGEMLTFVDPCFGYAASLIGVAVSLFRASKVKAKA